MPLRVILAAFISYLFFFNVQMCYIFLPSVLSISFFVIFSDASKFNQPFLPRGLINIQVFSPQWFDFFLIFNSSVHLECISAYGMIQEIYNLQEEGASFTLPSSLLSHPELLLSSRPNRSKDTLGYRKAGKAAVIFP